MNSFAPIALFVYRRLATLQQTVEALKKNMEALESELYIFSDAPKNENAARDVAEVRKYLQSIGGFKTVTIVEREKNFGLANSVIAGVSDVLEKYGKIIVVEDDLVTSPYFLKFMNDGLNYYEHDERVISIHGYCYPVKTTLPSTFFLRGADCWGWATWKRGWNLFIADGKYLLNELTNKNLLHRFNFDGTARYEKMLHDQISGAVDSWAVRWYASAFLHNKLTLYPGVSLVNNIGEDEHATHTALRNEFQTAVLQQPIEVGNIVVEESETAREAFKQYFRSTKLSLFEKIVLKMRQLLK